METKRLADFRAAGKFIPDSVAYALVPSASADVYGTQLAIGDFNGDNENDLAVGVPGHDTPADGSGGVQVVYQSEFLFVHGFDN